MRSPAEKYANDNDYRMLVDYMEAIIHKAAFTPSELREAAMLASIHYEQKSPRKIMYYTSPPEVEAALKVLDKSFANRVEDMNAR